MLVGLHSVAPLSFLAANAARVRSAYCWRAEIVLATADGLGTNAIMRRTGKSKPCVWRWQERYMQEGVLGLLRDKTRPARIAPLPAARSLPSSRRRRLQSPPTPRIGAPAR